MAGIMQLKRLFGGVEMKNNIRIEWNPENDNELTVYFTKTYFPYWIDIIIPAGDIGVKLDSASLARGHLVFEGSSHNNDYNISVDDNISWYFDNEEEGYLILYLSEADAEGIESAEDVTIDTCLCFDFIGHIEH